MTAEELRREQLNVRVPGMTWGQIELIQGMYGLTKTQLVIVAIDRLTYALDPLDQTPTGRDARRAIAKILAQTSD